MAGSQGKVTAPQPLSAFEQGGWNQHFPLLQEPHPRQRKALGLMVHLDSSQVARL